MIAFDWSTYKMSNCSNLLALEDANDFDVELE